ncbi:bifunctional 3,4-dihydroxy-2-butanone-4-phosphate synthase/GTP cyclohydrolase II [Nocardioides alkalitolerans]|uniref:bifunctional 3,4-dihydroxy-2-butanone-4-phosphate synthase/GTP cyclohydrolase II n=1 Tax=Nocardioides alkalitolerans TaxID=281714 RepID=UPI000424BCD1|nr:bifunctional 3,4-dihydroxy-2-butanone-4-phosphate synthase/GTP cyclohydrolase II [Nocardioides alkalitolerans]
MAETVRLDSVEQAVADIAAGRAVVVVDDEDRENEGDIIFAAAKATPELMAFTVRHSSGVICAPMPGEMLDRLEVPLMTPHNRDKLRTAYTISVDAKDGTTTGISAADRAHTVRVLADSATEPGDLTRPGHVFPLRYREGGVLVRRGHTEAAVDLARLAGLTPVGVLVEVVNDDGTMKRAPELRAFADEHGLAMISIEELVRYRRRTERHAQRVAETRLPTQHGEFTAYGYRISIDASEHVALVYGDLSGDEPVLTRVHSECLTGDVFGSQRCDCGPQLDESLARVRAEGRGVVVYLRGHEGRGIGLVAKLQAYQLQDGGRDTVDANLDLGLPADARHYGTATQILRDLGVASVRLLTNNPAKTSNLEEYGVHVAERVALTPRPNDHNIAYLLTKRDRMGHQLDGLDAYELSVPELDEADQVVDPPRVDPVTHDAVTHDAVAHQAHDGPDNGNATIPLDDDAADAPAVPTTEGAHR